MRLIVPILAAFLVGCSSSSESNPTLPPMAAPPVEGPLASLSVEWRTLTVLRLTEKGVAARLACVESSGAQQVPAGTWP